MITAAHGARQFAYPFVVTSPASFPTPATPASSASLSARSPSANSVAFLARRYYTPPQRPPGGPKVVKVSMINIIPTEQLLLRSLDPRATLAIVPPFLFTLKKCTGQMARMRSFL